MADTTDKPVTLPDKIVVTLRAGGVFFAIANIMCVSTGNPDSSIHGVITR